MWIRYLMMSVAAFFSVTAFILLAFQGVEFGTVILNLIRDLMHHKT